MANSNELFNLNDRTSEFDSNDAQENKLMCVLAYISILVLIPIFAVKNSKYTKFHSNQGLVLLIVEVIASAIIGILVNIPFIGWLFGIIGGLINLCCLVLSIIGIIDVINGKARELPVIGKIRIIK